MRIKTFSFDQPIGHFALGVMTAQQIIDCSTVDRLYFNQSTLEVEGGPQRELSAKRVSEISQYATTADATFPTPILLALQPGTYSVENDEIVFEDKKIIAKIIDGQHRIAGIIKSNKANDFTLPVVFIFDPTEEESALIFAIINGKQTKVPMSIIYELYNIAEDRNPYSTAHYIARSFNSDINSPYYRRLKMLGKKTPGSNEILSQGTFVKELLKHISDNLEEDFDLARRHKKCKVRPKCCFNEYFIDDNDDVIYKILLNIFNAAKDVFPNEWNNTKYILSKTTGYIAIMRSLPELLQYAKNSKVKSLERKTFKLVFLKVKELLLKSNLQLINNDFGSSESGQKKLSKIIVEATKNLLTESPTGNKEENILMMKNWFLSLYENPANSTYFESSEGGYQYIHSGEPFDTEEVLFREFSNQFTEDEIQSAKKQLEDENSTTEWVLINKE
ncbi:MAG: DGQHR domain-containing protein [Treponema sp.]|nr:DGQHR domain-containing protein [Treponema sp.]